jgi:hypothetical protein
MKPPHGLNVKRLLRMPKRVGAQAASQWNATNRGNN